MSEDTQQYRHVRKAVYGVPWAIEEGKFADIRDLLMLRASGLTLTPADIRARLGGDPPAPRRTTSSGSIAVIPIFGVLARRMDGLHEMSGGTSTDRLAADIRYASADSKVSAIALLVDSPGGSTLGITELAAVIRHARDYKPVTAIVDGTAASAAYWLASQAEDISITPSGSAGAIGVVIAHENAAGALKQSGVEITLVSAGKRKVDGNPFGPLSESARSGLQRRVDDAYDQFVNDIAQGRQVSAREVRTGFGEGAVLTASDALAAGMVDRIEPADAALARLASGGARTVPGALVARTTHLELQAQLAQVFGAPAPASDAAWRYRQRLALLGL